MTTNNPKPEEVQAGLDAALLKFYNAQPTPEKKAELLIKIGSYQVDLAKYGPMLADADEAMAHGILDEWIASGDGELKKALINQAQGAEEFPLLKFVPPEEGPEFELAKMYQAATSPAGQAAVLQKIGVYGQQVQTILDRAEALGVAQADIDTAVQNWVNAGDGSHLAMKKAVAADAQARATARASVGENEAVKTKIGNAPSHVGSQMGNPADRTYVPRSTGEGSGPREAGRIAAPGQDNGESPTPGSGTPEGQVNPSIKIRRKGTTGNMGSVAGGDAADGGGTSDAGSDGTLKGKKKKKAEMDKTGDLATELVKFLPDAMIGELAKLSPENQVEVCQQAAGQAADLMAWSIQQDPDKMEKAALSEAVTSWLQAEPDTLAMKKWVAEALATAEEIPLSLAKTIMEWEPPSTLRVRARAA
jgi:hypothetical protein